MTPRRVNVRGRGTQEWSFPMREKDSGLQARSDESDADGLDWPEHVARGRELVAQRDGAQWALGVLAATIDAVYGEKKIEAFALAIDIDPETFRNYRWVVSKYPSENVARATNLTWSAENVPRGTFSWTVYKMLAGRDDRAKWLAETVKNGWSARQLERELRGADDAARPQFEPEPQPFGAAVAKKHHAQFRPKSFERFGRQVIEGLTQTDRAFDELDAAVEESGGDILPYLKEDELRLIEKAVMRACDFAETWSVRIGQAVHVRVSPMHPDFTDARQDYADDDEVRHVAFED